jgi:hypothetical protein
MSGSVARQGGTGWPPSNPDATAYSNARYNPLGRSTKRLSPSELNAVARLSHTVMLSLTAAPATKDLAASGMLLASMLGRPLILAGKPVFIPDAIARLLWDGRPESTEAPAETMSNLEVARVACYAITMAEREINALGIEVGVLPAPSQPTPAPIHAATSPAPAQPPRFDIVRQDDGSLT